MQNNVKHLKIPHFWFFNYIISSSSSSECSAQRQVLHCKSRKLGCRSAEGRCRDLDTKTEWAKSTGSILDVDMEKDGACKMDRPNKSFWDVDTEKDGACKMDRQNKKFSSARKSWRKNNAGTNKEEENKLGRPLAKKELPAEGCSRRKVKGKKVRGRKRYQMIDNIMINGLYDDMKRKTEKRVE